jgi:hypothetical protein
MIHHRSEIGEFINRSDTQCNDLSWTSPSTWSNRTFQRQQTICRNYSCTPQGTRHMYYCKAGDILSSRHVSSRDVTCAVGIFNIEFWRTLTLLSLCLRHVIWRGALVGSHASTPLKPGTLSLRHVMLRVQLGYLIFVSGVHSHFCYPAYVTWSDVELWLAHMPARLLNFCWRCPRPKRIWYAERRRCMYTRGAPTPAVTSPGRLNQ